MTWHWIVVMVLALMGYFTYSALHFGEWYAERILRLPRLPPPKLSEILFWLFLGPVAIAAGEITALARHIRSRFSTTRPQVRP